MGLRAVHGKIYAATAAAALGGLLFGFDTPVINGACGPLGSASGHGSRRWHVRASSVGSGLAFAVWDLMAWRVVGGLAIGIASVIAPAYIGEIAPARLRGGLSSLQQLAITIGIFLALLLDAGLARGAGGAANELWWGMPAWRWMLLRRRRARRGLWHPVPPDLGIAALPHPGGQG